jgi:hypothetical protein
MICAASLACGVAGLRQNPDPHQFVVEEPSTRRECAFAFVNVEPLHQLALKPTPLGVW